MQGSAFKSVAVGLVGLLLLACGGGSEPSNGGDNDGLDGPGASSGSSGKPGRSEADENSPKGDCAVTQHVTKTTTWSATACPTGYLVKFQIEVRGADTELRIEPGTKVMLASTSSITVTSGAALVAKGTEGQKVVFEGSSESPASWMGLRIRSNNPRSELSHAVIRHAGSSENMMAALILVEQGTLALSETEIVDNGRLGLAMFDEAKLTKLERVTVARNDGGAAQLAAPLVKYLKGDGNSFAENGAKNSVIVEATALLKITEDTVWPSLTPAIYRIAGQNGGDGGILKVERHLEIEPGAIFELASGSGFLVAGGAAGLHAVGTAEKKIVFRGVDGSSWTGITFGESAWSGNRLEHVDVQGAAVAPSWGYYGTGNVATPKAGILLGYNFATPVQVALKDFSVAGPNNAPADVAVKGAAVLQVESGVVGTGAGGALAIQNL